MPRKSPSPPKLAVHFIGIGGIGISALARWFLSKKWAVTGSDLADSSIIEQLRKAGARVKIGHTRANLPKKGLDMVIYSQAVARDNPEVKEALRRGINPLSYPEIIGCLTKVYETIAIAGSHGKSTTTAMTGLILSRAGFDPNVVVGTNLKEFGGINFRRGRSRWLVLEADEWKASFLKYFPYVTVVTNIDKEHLDYYRNFGNVKKAFLKFLANTRQDGCLILNKEDKVLKSLKSPITKIAAKNNLKVFWYSTKNQNLRKILRIPGEHNLSNGAAAMKVAGVLGIKSSVAAKALADYRGAWRRMEYKGKLKVQNSKAKILVYDDYAHHPTEIKATLQAFRDAFPNQPLICVFQPHQVKRLKALFKEFISAFEAADILILLPIYEVAGRDKTSSSFTSKKLTAAIAKKYTRKNVFYLDDPARLKFLIRDKVAHFGYTYSPILVMMGAGDIVNLTPRLLS